MSHVLTTASTIADIRPLHDRVLLRRDKEEERSSGGIIIPDNAKERPQKGVVIAVGSGKVLEDGTTRKVDVLVGDHVLFSKYKGVDVTLEDEKYLLIREDEILGVMEETEAGTEKEEIVEPGVAT